METKTLDLAPESSAIHTTSIILVSMYVSNVIINFFLSKAEERITGLYMLYRTTAFNYRLLLTD